MLRLDEEKAFHAMRENPSDATRAEWERQQSISGWYEAAFSGSVFLIMAAPTYLAYMLFGARKKLNDENGQS